MSFRAEQRADLRALQRAVRDDVTVAEARLRIARDSLPQARPASRHAPRARSLRMVVAALGLGLVFWAVVITAAVSAGKLVTLLVWLLFAATGFLAIGSIARDVRTAIRWWRS